MSLFFASKCNSIEGVPVCHNNDGWGPVIGAAKHSSTIFNGMPYAHFDKKESCKTVADFAQSSQYNQHNQKYDYRNRYKNNENVEFAYKHDAVEDSTFQLVDTSKTQSKGKYPTKKTQPQQKRFSAVGKRDIEPFFNSFNSKGKRAGLGNTRPTGPKKFFKKRDRKLERMPSLTVGSEWVMVEEFDFAQMLKLVANPPVTEDLLWAGHLDQYDEAYDKLTTKNAKPLKRVENKVFYSVNTTDDPILQNFAIEEAGNVYATDAILAHLMAAPRSIYSWDIVIQKIGGTIYLDKRENSTFDFLTVSETAHEPPTVSDETEECNYPEKLSIEATMINQNFSQQVLKDPSLNNDESRKSYEPNPFFEDDESGMEPSSVAYRYRKFTLGNIKIVSRCELHAWIPKKDKEQLMTVYCLNEWDSKFSGGVNWRQKIDLQRGAVLVTELKNNSNKLARWTAQSILAGADQMKLGYVSRISPGNPYDHTVLATQYFKPKELAQQINLSVNNMWGIVKMISELVLGKEDGKYVIMKDPNKSTLRLYSVPLNTFEEEEEEVDEDNEGDNVE